MLINWTNQSACFYFSLWRCFQECSSNISNLIPPYTSDIFVPGPTGCLGPTVCMGVRQKWRGGSFHPRGTHQVLPWCGCRTSLRWLESLSWLGSAQLCRQESMMKHGWSGSNKLQGWIAISNISNIPNIKTITIALAWLTQYKLFIYIN